MSRALVSAAFLAFVPAVRSAQCELQELVPPEGGRGFGWRIAQDGPEIAIGSAERVDFFRQEGLHAYRGRALLRPAGLPATFETIALDGDTFAVTLRGGLGAGDAVLVHAREKGEWVQRARIASVEPASVFGRALALDGERLAVGAPGEDAGGLRGAGAVYLYGRVGDGWKLVRRIEAPKPLEGEGFGASLDLQRGRLAVGTSGAPAAARRAFVFERADERLEPSVIAPLATAAASAGMDLDLAGDRLLIADCDRASGTLARVFEHDGARWDELAALRTADAFGRWDSVTVALADDGRRALIGSFEDEERGRLAGAAFVFEEVRGGWMQLAKLRPEAPGLDRAFGSDVSCSGDLAVIGCPGKVSAFTYSLSGETCRTLRAQPAQISLGLGGRQTLRLNPGAELAGERFLLLGSATGTDPGLRLRGARVPLVRDWYFAMSWPGQRRAPFVDNVGVLRAASPQAVVTLDVPPGTSLALAGLVLRHAFVVLDGAGVAHVSNATTLELVP